MGKILALPQVSLGIGCLLLFAGICEIFETVLEEIIGYEIKTAHGLIIFALSQISIAATHVLEGIEDVSILAETEEIRKDVKDAKAG